MIIFGLLSFSSVSAQEAYLAEVKMFAGNFAPRGWALCDGQILAISSNSALFSLLGTTFGGDGRTTFALPDLRGRVPMHAGNGPGLSTYRIGQKGGAEKVTLTANQIPYSTEDVKEKKENAGSKGGTTSSSSLSSNTNAAQPVSIVQPYLSINYIICVQGMFPSRN